MVHKSQLAIPNTCPIVYLLRLRREVHNRHTNMLCNIYIHIYIRQPITVAASSIRPSVVQDPQVP